MSDYWFEQRVADAECAELGEEAYVAKMVRQRNERAAGVLKDAKQRVTVTTCRQGCACAGGLGYCDKGE